MTADRVTDLELRGIGVSAGVVKGKVLLLDRGKVEVEERHIRESQVEAEISLFHRALTESRRQLDEVVSRVESALGVEHLYILETHRMMLDDRPIIEDTERLIRQELLAAEWAFKKVITSLGQPLEASDDDYLRDRASDVEHVANRVLRNLTGRGLESVAAIDEKAVVVARDLAPSDTAQMTKSNVIGFTTDMGSRTSHTAIMARSLSIPAVVGLKDVSRFARTGDTIVVDGTSGTVVVNPGRRTLKEFSERRRRFLLLERELKRYRHLPAQTGDGHRIKLLANVEMLDEIPSVEVFGGDGVGLYRTEFLYLNRPDLPSEEEHFQVYRKAAEGVYPQEAVIRTVDLGGDKFVSPLSLPQEMNPAMGLRAIRFCLKEVEIFKVQLRAVLRASAYGRLKIMFPMISGVDEIKRAKAILEEAKAEVRAAGFSYDREMKTGIMIEIPSAAVVADLLAREVDFFSIGTNDLIQYFLAIDRVNEQVAYLYEPLHPAVLRSIIGAVEAGHRAGITVGMCGEMAGEPLYALILLALGLDELSMAPHSIPLVKRVICEGTTAEGEEMLAEVMPLATAREIEERVMKRMAARFPEWFFELKQ